MGLFGSILDAWRYRLGARTGGSQPSNQGSIPCSATRLTGFPKIAGVKTGWNSLSRLLDQGFIDDGLITHASFSRFSACPSDDLRMQSN